jgi:MFS family permease
MTHRTTDYKRLFTPELVAVLFVWCMAFFAGEILTPILPLYMSSIGLDAHTIGLMFSVMMVGIAISELFWGWVVDRVDLKIAILMGTMMYGAIISVLTVTKTLPLFAIVIFVYGFCRSPIFIVGRWFMGVYAPADMKASAMALLSVSISIVQMLSGFASGYITQARGFSFTFWLAAGIAVTAGIVILIAGRWLNFQNHKTTRDEPISRTKQNVSVSREVKLFTISLGFIGTLFFVGYGIFATYLPLYASGVTQANTSQVGVLFGIRGLISTVAMLPVGRLADRKGKWTLMPFGVGIVALAMASIAFSRSYLMLVASVIIFSLGSAIYLPLGAALLSQSIPVFWTGTAMGIYGLMEDFGWMIGPAIGGMLWEGWSQQATFMFASIMALMGIPVILLVRRRMSRASAVNIQQKLPMEQD